MPTNEIRVNVAANGNNSLNVSVPRRAVTVNFYTADNSSVEINFSGTPPFTDTTNPFTVQGSTGVNRTVDTNTSTGSHDFTAGQRTGDIDITLTR